MALELFPSSPSFESVNFKVNTPMLKTQTNSGKITRVAMGHQFYSFTAKFPRITSLDLGKVTGFISFTLGGYSAFEIILPEISYTKATQTPSGTVTTTAAITAGAQSVAVTNVGTGNTVLRAGDFFKFSNHSKVYMATSDLTGNSTLTFGGALVYDVPSGATLTITEVPFTVVLDSDAQEFDTGVGGISTLSLDMREVW